MDSKVIILGATGKTGRLTAAELVGAGREVLLAGRDEQSLGVMSDELEVPHAKIDIRDGAALSSLFEGCSVVINCVGPFVKFGYVPVEAAIEAGVDYVDSSWEQEFLHELRSRHEAAARKGVAIVPGLGVSPGVSDLLVSLACAGLEEIERVSIHYVEGMANRFSYGTLHSTALALSSKAMVFSGGQFVSMQMGSRTKRVDFGGSFGVQKLIAYPGGDIVNVPGHVKVDEVEHFIGLETATVGLRLLSALPFDADGAVVRGACAATVKLQHLVFWGNRGFAVQVEVAAADDGDRAPHRILGTSSDDPYVVTARMLARGACTLSEDESHANGVLSPAQIFDASRMLQEIGVTTDEPGAGG